MRIKRKRGTQKKGERYLSLSVGAGSLRERHLAEQW